MFLFHVLASRKQTFDLCYHGKESADEPSTEMLTSREALEEMSQENEVSLPFVAISERVSSLKIHKL